MKTLQTFLLILIATGLSLMAEDQSMPNPLIDYNGFMANAVEVGKLRETHRVSEQDFLRMAGNPAPSFWTRGMTANMNSFMSRERCIWILPAPRRPTLQK